MCNCRNVEIGGYANQVTLVNWWNANYICIDKCLMDEILELWDNSVQTNGCCCGHNKATPYIGVIPIHHEKMIELGYEFWENEYGVLCYKPKSILTPNPQ